MGAVVQTKSLCKGFVGKYVVNTMNMEINRRDIYGLVGENGTGKITLMCMLCGSNIFINTSREHTIWNRGKKMTKYNQKTKTRYYQSFADDFVESGNQSFQLPDNYMWIHRNFFYRMVSKCLYLLAELFAFLYCWFWLHARIINRSVLGQCAKSGFFLYGNHTQEVGDAFIPVRALAPKRIYVAVSPANLGIPFLGPLLPMLGALPLPDGVTGMKKLIEAIRLRITERHCVVFYPEAHVWSWYTGIRPFPVASFGFPVEYGAPSFCMTTTYQKRKHRKKPGITVYLDGPFYSDSSLPKKKQKEQLRDEVHDCMIRRSQNSTYQYIKYERAK